jgi:hypothetical protein
MVRPPILNDPTSLGNAREDRSGGFRSVKDIASNVTASAVHPAVRIPRTDSSRATNDQVSALQDASIAPNRSISTRTTSPAFRNLGGRIAAPTPPGVPVKMTSPA